MSLYVSLDLKPSRGRCVKAGKIAKEQLNKLRYERFMGDALGHSDRDYFNLKHAEKAKKQLVDNSTNIPKSFNDFFELDSVF